MARLTILIALLVALLFVAFTSASRESCQKQLQGVNLRHCEKHIMHRIQQQQQQEEEEGEEEDVLHLRGINYIRSGGGQQKQLQHLKQCCEQLSELNSPKCQCRALQQIMEEQSEQLEGREMQQMLRKELKNLPRFCGLGPLRECDLRCED